MSKLIPAALLNVKGFDTANNWIHTVPQGCKCTLKKATLEDQNFMVTDRPISDECAAPHSSYAHFLCGVVQPKVRLLSNKYGPLGKHLHQRAQHGDKPVHGHDEDGRERAEVSGLRHLQGHWLCTYGCEGQGAAGAVAVVLLQQQRGNAAHVVPLGEGSGVQCQQGR